MTHRSAAQQLTSATISRTEHKLHWVPAYVFYHFGFIFFALSLIGRLHKAMVDVGTFDENNRGRDMVDDAHVNQLGRSIFIYTALRSVGPFMMAWRGEMTNPFDGLSIWTPVKIGIFEVALGEFPLPLPHVLTTKLTQATFLDYFFYLYVSSVQKSRQN